MNFILNERIKRQIIALVCALVSATSNAETVFFDDADRAPGDTLQISGVTASSLDFFNTIAGQPATVSGSGLGIAALGLVGSVDRQEHFLAGDGGSSSYLREGISLSVDGRINSVTLLPHFSILGSAEPVFLPFDLSFYQHGTGGNTDIQYRTPTGPDQLTLSFQPGSLPSSVDLFLVSDFGNAPYFHSYLEEHGFPDITFQFGFTIQSLDYTPAAAILAVPEASTTALLCVGLLVLLGAKRKLILNQFSSAPVLKKVQPAKEMISRKRSTRNFH